MTWATKAQLPKQVFGSIMFKKINFTAPLKMAKTTYQWTRRVSSHSNEPKPTIFSKTPIKVE
jgi:hypothetical protein